MQQFYIMAIKLNDALDITNKEGIPFQIKFVSFDKSRNKGGEITELTNAERTGSRINMKANDMISVKQLNNSNHHYPVHTHLIIELNKQKVFI